MTQYTPPPWAAKPTKKDKYPDTLFIAREAASEAASCRVIAKVYGRDGKHAVVNASLMVNAPEMFALIVQCSTFLKSGASIEADSEPHNQMEAMIERVTELKGVDVEAVAALVAKREAESE